MQLIDNKVLNEKLGVFRYIYSDNHAYVTYNRFGTMTTRTFFISTLIATLASFGTGCKKTSESALDCFAQSLLVSVKATTDAGNAKLVHLEAVYSGDLQVKSVVWEYGDGTPAVTGTATTTHTYAAAGSFTVKAKISLVKGSSTCTPEPTKAVTIN